MKLLTTCIHCSTQLVKGKIQDHYYCFKCPSIINNYIFDENYENQCHSFDIIGNSTVWMNIDELNVRVMVDEVGVKMIMIWQVVNGKVGDTILKDSRINFENWDWTSREDIVRRVKTILAFA